MTSVSDAFRHHHEQLAQTIAKQVEALTKARSGLDLEPLLRFLRGELLPHAAGEEQYLYPAVEPLVKAHGTATATMSIDHRAIEGYVRSLETLAGRLRNAESAERDELTREVTRLLWQLQALFDVHLRKEEQVYLPLFERYVPAAEQQRILEQMHEAPPARTAANDVAVVDVRPLPPVRRHPLIFQTFDALRPGQAFLLVNDHDPKPLYYQFEAEQPGTFTWTYLEQGPEVWRVRIGRSRAAGAREAKTG